MSDERKNSKTIKSQVGGLAERVGDLEQLKKLHEDTIRVQQEAGTVASSQITVQLELSYMIHNHTHTNCTSFFPDHGTAGVVLYDS